MKLLPENNTENQFTPFTLNLLIENEDEARLMFLVFNTLSLTEVLINNSYNNQSEYITPRITKFEGCEVLNYIRTKVEVDK